MNYRKPKTDDQETANRAFILLQTFMRSHPEIEGNMWAAACWSVLVKGYVDSGIPYELFCKEWENVREFYKPCWDAQKDDS